MLRIINLILLYILVEYFDIWYMAAQIVGVLSNGIEKCIDGTKWETIVYPKNDPLVQFKTRNYIYEENPQASAGEEIEVLIKFYCPGGNCDVEVK